MLAPSQEENTNPNETRFVSYSDGTVGGQAIVVAQLILAGICLDAGTA